MPTKLVTGCWLLAFAASAALAQPQQRPNPTAQSSIQTLPANPFPRANSVLLQTNDPVPVAMDRLVRYYQTQGYVVDTVDREVFFTVRAHTTLQLPQRPVRMDVRASFGSSPLGNVWLRATYEPTLANGQVRPQQVRTLAVYQPELLPAPVRRRQVRYTTFLAPARRAAFVELQRVSRGAFPEATLTYANAAP